MSRNYWASVLDARMTAARRWQRRALAAGAAFAPAVARPGRRRQGDNSPLTKPADTTKMRREGGALKRHTGSDSAGSTRTWAAPRSPFYEIAYARLNHTAAWSPDDEALSRGFVSSPDAFDGEAGAGRSSTTSRRSPPRRTPRTFL